MQCVTRQSLVTSRWYVSAQIPWVITHGKGCVGLPGLRRGAKRGREKGAKHPVWAPCVEPGFGKCYLFMAMLAESHCEKSMRPNRSL